MVGYCGVEEILLAQIVEDLLLISKSRGPVAGPINISPECGYYSAEIDKPSMNSRPGSFSNSRGASFSLPDRLPAPRMM